MPPQLNLWKKTFSNHLNVDKSAFWEWKTSTENRQKIVTQNRWGEEGFPEKPSAVASLQLPQLLADGRSFAHSQAQ